VDYRLTVFQAVAERLSFTKASRALHLSQPAVTQHMKTLEAEFGQALFNRSHHGITLTSAGETLLRHAHQVAQLDHEVAQQIRGERGIIRGRLRIGATSTIGQYLLPGWLVQARRSWPALQLGVVIGNTEEIIDNVLARKIDLGLVEGRCQRVGLRAECFLEDEIVCVAAADHAVTKAKPLSIARLKDQIWISREQGSGTRDIAELALKRHGLDPRRLNIDLELASSEAIKAVVAAGHGLAFLSRFVVAREIAAGSLRIVPVRGLSIGRKLVLIYPRGPRPPGAAAAFIDLVLTAAPKIGQ
jgi:DNA-binding transcriptional LysR family regulator